MIAVVAAETVLLLVLLVLVAGLLRSHAEILRRLRPADDRPLVPAEPASPVQRDDSTAAPLSGLTPTGDALSLAFEGPGSVPTLLAFLTSGCSTCAGFWETLAEPRLPPGVQTLIVAKGSEQEQPAKLRSLSPRGIPVIMSSQAWTDYQVPGAPYFVLVDGAVRGEGVATSWHALSSLVRDAIADQLEAERQRDASERTGAGPKDRARTIDETFAAAGIGADDPSLYPSRGD
jgi:hypothetical protein